MHFGLITPSYCAQDLPHPTPAIRYEHLDVITQQCASDDLHTVLRTDPTANDVQTSLNVSLRSFALIFR